MGLQPILIKYPLDLTGHNPTNLVLQEPHTLLPGINRVVVPRHGGYYTASLRIRDVETGEELVPRTQFKAVQLYQDATAKTGLEIAAAVVITDADVSDNVTIDYQCVGGEFSLSGSAIEEAIAALDLDSRPIKWGDLLGLPEQFPPAPHLHDAGDLFGFEYLVEAIDSLKNAIIVGQEATISELRTYITTVDERVENLELSCDELRSIIAGFNYEEIIQTHIEDFENPHQVTVEDVGLGVLIDTPLVTVNAVESLIADIFDGQLAMLIAHLEFLGNKHAVTAEQVELGALDNQVYMTVAAVVGVINGFIDYNETIYTEHMALTNPHALTLAQLGLEVVDNIPYLTVNQVEANTEVVF